MDDSQHTERAKSFGTVAAAYAENRPDYPIAAVRWLLPGSSARVLELGAGTGKLTDALLTERHRVTATDPAYAMLDRLRTRLQSARAIQSVAEQIPVHAGAMDTVVAAQAFHWFDHRRALPEIARVLRPDGTLALVWNYRDETVPWVRRLSQIIGSEGMHEDYAELLEGSGLFDRIETRTFRHWQQVDRDSLIGLVRSRSYVAAMGERERADVLEAVGALYDEYGRGHDGMLLPYVTHCIRARVVGTRPSDGLDDGLLIDFS